MDCTISARFCHVIPSLAHHFILAQHPSNSSAFLLILWHALSFRECTSFHFIFFTCHVTLCFFFQVSFYCSLHIPITFNFPHAILIFRTRFQFHFTMFFHMPFQSFAHNSNLSKVALLQLSCFSSTLLACMRVVSLTSIAYLQQALIDSKPLQLAFRCNK